MQKLSSRPNVWSTLQLTYGESMAMIPASNPTISPLSTQENTHAIQFFMRSLFWLKQAAARHISSLTIKLSTSDGKTISSRNHKISRHINSFNRFSVSLSFATSSMKLRRKKRRKQGKEKKQRLFIPASISSQKSREEKNNALIKCANTEFTLSICEWISCPLCERKIK